MKQPSANSASVAGDWRGYYPDQRDSPGKTINERLGSPCLYTLNRLYILYLLCASLSLQSSFRDFSKITPVSIL